MIANRLTIGQYYPRDSLVHRLDARLKIIVSLLYMIALFVANSWPQYVFLTGLFLVALGFSQVPLRSLWRGLRMIMIFILISMLFNFFLVEGQVIWQWGFLHLTVEGLKQGMMIGVRLVLLVFFASLLTLTTKPLDLTDGLERLLSPWARVGAPIHEFAMIIAISIRFIPTILQEFDRILLAQKARGAHFSGAKLSEKVQRLMPLLIPLFVGSFRRADELALAMDARCYHGKGRTRWRVCQWQVTDTVVLCSFTVVLLVMIWMRIKGG